MSFSQVIEYNIHKRLNLYTAKAKGEITFEHLSAHVQTLMQDPKYYVGINAFYDFRKVTRIMGNLDAFRNLASDMSNPQVIHKQAKTAILVSDTHSSVSTMMEGYLLMTSASLIDYKLFNQVEITSAKRHVNLNQDFDLKSINISDE